jgi:hypothetical protein
MHRTSGIIRPPACISVSPRSSRVAGPAAGLMRAGPAPGARRYRAAYFEIMVKWALLFFAHAASLCPGSSGISSP